MDDSCGSLPSLAALSAALTAAFPRGDRRLTAALLRCCGRWGISAEADLLLLLAADPPRAAHGILSAIRERAEPPDIPATAARRYVSALLRALCARRAVPVVSVSRLSRGGAAACFTTGCARLDALLRGGLRGGALTELHGEAGSGKTQLALQALVLAARGGAAALCLAAEELPAGRLAQLAAAHAPRAGDAERVLAAVQIRRVAGLREIAQMMRDGALRAAFRACGGRGVVVIDSVAAANDGEHAEAVGAMLKAFAVEEHAAVIATNQVRAVQANGPALVPKALGFVAPALGAQWAFAPHVRVRLRRTQLAKSVRQLTVLSGPAHPPLSGTFVIDKNGVHAEE